MLTLAAHGLLVAFLLLEKRFGERELPPPRQVTGQWITLSYVPPPQEPEVETEEIPAAPWPRVRMPRISLQDRPATAITLVAPTVAPVAPEGSAPPSSPNAVEWREQAAALASRYAEEMENPATFSPPPVVMRQPCKPRKSSMWPAKPKKFEPNVVAPVLSEMGPTTMMGGMPIGTVGGSLGGGAVGGGGIRIPLGKPEPNGHLFDDMKKGKTPVSSVPDHERCD